MCSFITENWLIKNKTGERLYHEVAAGLPVIDYHNHLCPEQLARNAPFENLTSLWITDDPYKHRAMRINGIPEAGITGESDDFEKYMNWVETLPKTIGNPLFHWSGLELKRVFGIDEALNKTNAKAIWEDCNAMLRLDNYRPLEMTKMWHAEVLITSDDALDELASHAIIKMASKDMRVLPSLRGDSIVEVDRGIFRRLLNALSNQGEAPIADLRDFTTRISERLDFFTQNGCLFADHALDAGFTFVPTSETEATGLFARVLNSTPLESSELVKLKSFLLTFLGEEYGNRGWTMQLHIGAQRNTSTRLRKLAGAAGGYAGIGTPCDINSLALFLDSMEQNAALPEIILYTLNPSDNAAFASLTGSYAQDGVVGKVQFGPAWWYNDHYDGIRQHLTYISSIGLLRNFIGMTTDSRSILSLSRHEYFRRIFCDLLGSWAEEGLVPNDFSLLEQIVGDVSYFNIRNRILKMEKVWQV